MDLEDILYNKILVHSNCTVEIETLLKADSRAISAIEIANYGNGESLAIECIKCNEVIIDIDRPQYGGE